MAKERFFGGARLRVLVPALIAVAFVGWLDRAVGLSLTLSPFYLLPIALVAWRAARWPAIVLAVLSTITSLVGDLTHHAAEAGFAPYWNAAVRLPVLVAAAVLIARLRTLLEHERATKAAIAEAAEGLRQASESKTTFLRAVAHDLRGPATAIFGGAASLEARWDVFDEHDRIRLLRSVTRGSSRLVALLEDLLDVERLGSEHVELKVEDVDVDRVLREAVQDSGLALTHEVVLDAHGAVARVDRVVLERIAYNMSANSAKHVPGGAPVWIGAEVADDRLLLTFDDAGPGIAPQDRERVFEAFERGSGSGQRGWGRTVPRTDRRRPRRPDGRPPGSRPARGGRRRPPAAARSAREGCRPTRPPPGR
jgi:K+-sensing histidine kinase KdpD